MTRKPLLHLVAAVRPNFMKVAPLYHELKSEGRSQVKLVHTGQHYDDTMSSVFLRDLRLPVPHIHLGVGSGTHAHQTARVMMAYEQQCLAEPPDLVIVVGDVNSTMAAALVGAKLGIPVAHLEAGLRSFDVTMPEEINRLVTDRLATLLWTPSEDADINLKNEGVPPNRIERVGNIMIDSFELLRPAIEATHSVSSGEYVLVTLHRPHNVDDSLTLSALLDALSELAREIEVVFPIHPRTRKSIETNGLAQKLESSKVTVLEPLSYLQFMATVLDARMVITDSGGIQEETTYLGIPCITVRPNTERPITVTRGTNVLVEPADLARVAAKRLLEERYVPTPIPLWDGRTAERVTASLRRYFD